MNLLKTASKNIDYQKSYWRLQAHTSNVHLFSACNPPTLPETGHHGTDPLWYRPIMVQTHYGTLAIARLLRVNFVIVK